MSVSYFDCCTFVYSLDILPGHKIVDVCQNQTFKADLLEIRSPNYPSSLPGDRDCRCDVIGPPSGHVTVVLEEVSLGMHQKMCHDWLAVVVPGHYDDKLVACGDVKDADKVVQPGGNKLSVQFHTAKGMHPENLKGFKVNVRSKEIMIYSKQLLQYCAISLKISTPSINVSLKHHCLSLGKSSC